MLHTSVDYIGGTIAITVITAIAHTSSGKSQKRNPFVQPLQSQTVLQQGTCAVAAGDAQLPAKPAAMKHHAIAPVRADATGEACCR